MGYNWHSTTMTYAKYKQRSTETYSKQPPSKQSNCCFYS